MLNNATLTDHNFLCTQQHLAHYVLFVQPKMGRKLFVSNHYPTKPRNIKRHSRIKLRKIGIYTKACGSWKHEWMLCSTNWFNMLNCDAGESSCIQSFIWRRPSSKNCCVRRTTCITARILRTCKTSVPSMFAYVVSVLLPKTWLTLLKNLGSSCNAIVSSNATCAQTCRCVD